MYIISLSETWHPFIHFLEKNNLSGFFCGKTLLVTKSICFKFWIWQWQGAFSPKRPRALGVGEWFADSLTQTWIMVCKSDLVNHLQFFFELLPPPLFIIGHCDKSRKHGKISIALPWLQVQSQFSLKPSLKAEFLVLVATFGNPHHGSNQTKFPVVRKHTIFLKMKSMSMYIMTIMSRSMMIYLENVREPTYSRFDD